VIPGPRPASTASCRAHVRNARVFISGSNFLGIVIHPEFEDGTKPRPIQYLDDVATRLGERAAAADVGKVWADRTA